MRGCMLCLNLGVLRARAVCLRGESEAFKENLELKPGLVVISRLLQPLKPRMKINVSTADGFEDALLQGVHFGIPDPTNKIEKSPSS